MNTNLNTSVPTSINDAYAVPSLPVEKISDKEDKANKGIANGYAPLDSNTKVPEANLPSSVVLTGDPRLIDSRTPTAHTHTKSQITDFTHTHTVADVTGLQNALDGKQASGNYAPTAHTHAISDVTNLQTALDGKQASGSYATLVNGTIPLTQLPTQNALDAEVIAFSIALG